MTRLNRRTVDSTVNNGVSTSVIFGTGLNKDGEGPSIWDTDTVLITG